MVPEASPSAASNQFLFGKIDVSRSLAKKAGGDIDLNYIGAAGRETMLAERPSVARAFVCGLPGSCLERGNTPGAECIYLGEARESRDRGGDHELG